MFDRLVDFSTDSTKAGPHFPQRASRATCEYAVLLSLRSAKYGTDVNQPFDAKLKNFKGPYVTACKHMGPLKRFALARVALQRWRIRVKFRITLTCVFDGVNGRSDR
jgi:hypothetical protein